MPSSTSLTNTNSSAVCERAESPTPILRVGKVMCTWSLIVGEPNVDKLNSNRGEPQDALHRYTANSD